jgi:Polyketide cyclase / dehydrase and lipid transport
MITVNRTRHIDATPAAIFAALSDPDNLSGLLPRVRRIEFIERKADHARIATHMAFGLFGEIRSEGEVRWQTDREVVFRSRLPLLVESRWTLTPANGGTDLRAALSLDLAPLIGPLAALVPPNQVTRMIAPDLDSALAEIASRVESRDKRAVSG